MPAPLAALAAIGLPPLIGGISGQQQIKAQKQINEQNIQFQKETLQNQRTAALQDWDKVNAYNHPAQQMQRYKESGLNPQLIYGNASNTPASMIRNTNMESPKADSRGIIEGIGTMGQAMSGGIQNIMAMQTLDNQTNLTKAQILKLKADTDRSVLEKDITSQQFQDLIMSPFYKNLSLQTGMAATDQNRIKTEKETQNLPTKAMAYERYLAETSKTNANAKHALELFNLAKLQGKLKQADVDMLENLSAGPLGISTAISLLKMILGK
jgi:hypothetical protein